MWVPRDEKSAWTSLGLQRLSRNCLDTSDSLSIMSLKKLVLSYLLSSGHLKKQVVRLRCSGHPKSSGGIMQPTGVLESTKATKNPLKELLTFGQSMWLDYIRRD